MKSNLMHIAHVYRHAVLNGLAPTLMVARYLGASRATAGRHIAKAREAGLLPPSNGTRPWTGEHHPVGARLTGAAYVTFTVCRTCLTNWPLCRGAEDAVLLRRGDSVTDCSLPGASFDKVSCRYLCVGCQQQVRAVRHADASIPDLTWEHFDDGLGDMDPFEAANV